MVKIYSNLTTLLLSIVLVLLVGDTESNMRPATPFRWSRTKNCYTHPSERDISEAQCLNFSNSTSENIENCKWHHEGVCLQCEDGFFVDFTTFKDGNLKCSECARGCALCKGSRNEDCWLPLPGFRYSIARNKIEGCAVLLNGNSFLFLLF